MTALRKILLTGGPDARHLRVVDAETGKELVGVVKVELLCTPDGALINVTQACRVAAIDVAALDAGVPLIDLPDDHPEVLATEKVVKPAPAAPLLSELSEPTKQVLMDLARLAGPEEPARAVRRAPPPEVAPVVEPDLSADDKAELAQLLEKAATPAPGEALQRQQIARSPWPFPSMSLKGSR